MAVHVDSLNDLASTNEGIALSLNRFTSWSCQKSVTEAPLKPESFGSKLKDYATIAVKGDTAALNYSYLVLTVAPTVSVGTPGEVSVEIVNPNMEGPFQSLAGQSLTWSVGTGKPCMMIFSMHHQLAVDEDPFRVRITNAGIPTAKTFARVHAYWGFSIGSKLRCHKMEEARLIDIEVGYQKTLLTSIKEVRQYLMYTLDTTRMASHPQLCAISSMSAVPKSQLPPRMVEPGVLPFSAGKPSVTVKASEPKRNVVDEWVSRNEPNKLRPLSDSGSSSFRGDDQSTVQSEAESKTLRGKAARSQSLPRQKETRKGSPLAKGKKWF